MKVYFEVTGGECKQEIRYHWIKCYVKPYRKGGAYFYNIEGNLIETRGYNFKDALQVDSSDLPKEMWYSFKHGIHFFKQPTKVSKIYLDNNEISISNLLYEKVTPTQVKKYKQAKKVASSIKSLDELNKVVANTIKSKIIPPELMQKIAIFAPKSILNLNKVLKL